MRRSRSASTDPRESLERVTSVATSVGSNSALAQSLYTPKLRTPEQGSIRRAQERNLADAATSWTDRLRNPTPRPAGEAEGRAAASAGAIGSRGPLG